MMLYIIMLLLSFILINPVNAAFDQEMLSGARPIALGGSFVAIADDCNAVSVNSAGLSQIENPQILLYNGLMNR